MITPLPAVPALPPLPATFVEPALPAAPPRPAEPALPALPDVPPAALVSSELLHADIAAVAKTTVAKIEKALRVKTFR
jgi:hypothetical protein